MKAQVDVSKYRKESLTEKSKRAVVILAFMIPLLLLAGLDIVSTLILNVIFVYLDFKRSPLKPLKI